MEEEPFPEPDFAHAADPFPDPEPTLMVVEGDSDDYGPFKQTSSSPLNQSNVGVSSFCPQSPVQTPAHSQVGAPYSDAGARTIRCGCHGRNVF
jgi:hypothetical protein